MKKIIDWFKEETVEKIVSCLFILAIAIMLSCSVAHAQTTPRDSSTTKTYTVKSTKEVLKVYIGKAGGLYVWRKSAKNKPYKQYLKKEVTK
jgi:biopolymer transport protein ExbD